MNRNNKKYQVEELNNPEFKEAVAAYDRLLDDNNKEDTVGIKKISRYRQPLIRLRRAGRVKRYKVTAIINSKVAEKNRKKEFRHSKYLKYILLCVLFLFLIFLVYAFDPVQKLSEIVKFLGY